MFLYGTAHTYYNLFNKKIYMYNASPQCHTGTRAGPRGAATWPCVPRRIRLGSRGKCPIFAFNLIVLNVSNSK